MIRIKDDEQIKRSGTFRLDKVLVKKYYFEKQASGEGRESLVIEAVPFSRLDDGTIVYSNEVVKKVYISNLTQKLQSGEVSMKLIQAMINAYIATEKAIAAMLTELADFECEWEEDS
tara:strand:+ start:11916 stop:12266 length:351 start_codon:yes stop_codon:yes gene_type:complete